MIVPTLLLVGGIALLWAGAEALVRGAATLGTRVGVSPIVVGLTVVSLGTSAPELVVCVLAVLGGSSDLAMGNVLGSNLANMGLILGAVALFQPLGVASRVVARDMYWMLGVTFLVAFLLLNLSVGRLEGLLLLVTLAAYLYSLVPEGRRERIALLGEAGIELEAATGHRVLGLRDVLAPLGLVAVGSVILVGGGQAIVRGATSVALELGVSEMMVGLSVVAVGTSLPELATTVVAAARKQVGMAVGNIVGSNIFNLTMVLGGTALVRPLDVRPGLVAGEYLAVLVLSLLLFPILRSRRKVARIEGALLLLAYAGAWVWIQAV